MSSTTLYAIEQDGSLTEWTEYKNSHGSAMAIWSTLAAKHIANVKQLGERDYSKRNVFDPDVTRELWQLANAGGMEEYERRTYWTTYDRAVVRIEDVPLYAEALAEFARVHGPEHERLGYVFHVGTIAEDLRKIYDEREEKSWRGVAWNQTSLADTWHSQEPTEEMRRSAISGRVQEALDGATLADGHTLADEVTDVVMEMQDGEDRVADNIDTFGCLWLPGAGIETLA